MRTYLRKIAGIATGCSALLVTLSYGRIDPFQISAQADSPVRFDSGDTDKNPCVNTPLPSALSLYDAVSRALCNNPVVQRSWANVLIGAAQVGEAKSQYLPTISATATQQHSANAYGVRSLPQLDAKSQVTSRVASLSLSWVLFDFGQRAANLKYYKRLLDLAKFADSDTLQTVFGQTASAYYSVWAAGSALRVAEEDEGSAAQSYHIAQRKHALGVGTLNDELQARTAWQQTIYDRVDASGNLRVAQGNLSVVMGLPVNTHIDVDITTGAHPDLHFDQSVDELLAMAEEVNPKLRAAKALVEADEANEELANRQELPTISLFGDLQNSRQLAAVPRDSHTNSKVVGIQISIPIFSGFGQEYHRQASEAQVSVDRADLKRTELQVAISVWKSFQDVITRTESLTVAQSLLESARQAYDVANKRYAAGVGNLLDLLNAQTALAKAGRQQIQSQTDWRLSRFSLALAIGKLDNWDETKQAEAP